MHTTQPRTLITGGTGKTGRRVADRLAARGVPTRIAARSTAPAFDWHDPSSWAPVLDGVDAAYLAFAPDLSFPGAAEAAGRFADQAVAHGVRRLVLLSGRGEEGTWPAEAAVRDAGAEWTILRCSWFAQNFSEHFLHGAVLDGLVALPVPDVGEPFVDLDDLADAAVAALTEDGHHGRTYELTGPRLLTFADAATELAAATGRDVAFLSVTADEYAAAAVDAGVPADEVGPLVDLFRRVLDGRNAFVTDDLERILGRAPTDFGTYARRAAAAGAWSLDGEEVA